MCRCYAREDSESGSQDCWGCFVSIVNFIPYFSFSTVVVSTCVPLSYVISERHPLDRISTAAIQACLKITRNKIEKTRSLIGAAMTTPTEVVVDEAVIPGPNEIDRALPRSITSLESALFPPFPTSQTP